MPDVPTIDESGVKGFDGGSWAGLVMPAGTPRDIVMKVSADMEDILKAPAIRQKIRDMGGTVVVKSPDAFAAFAKDEVGKWAKVVKDAGIKAN